MHVNAERMHLHIFCTLHFSQTGKIIFLCYSLFQLSKILVFKYAKLECRYNFLFHTFETCMNINRSVTMNIQ